MKKQGKKWHLVCIRCGARYSYTAGTFEEMSYRKRSYCDRCVDDAVDAMIARDRQGKAEPSIRKSHEWEPVTRDATEDRIRMIHMAIDCRKDDPKTCGIPDCPYTPEECDKQIISDVRTMVSGRTPRIYSYDELFGPDHPDNMFIERLGNGGAIRRAVFRNGFYTFHDGSYLEDSQYNRDHYNKSYRCWSEYPDKARRLNEPWIANNYR